MGAFDIPGFLPGKNANNTENTVLNDKLLTDSKPPICKIDPGFERVPTQLPGDRFNPNECTAYRANSGLVAQYRQAKDSVVYIESQSAIPGTNGALKSPSTGSGFIATADGRVVTGYHVVKDAAANGLSITLPDGKKYQAQVEYLDQKSELAVLRLLRQPGETFKPLAMANDSNLKPGERVAALGYPRGVREVFLSVGGRWQAPSAFESPSQFAQNKLFMAADGSGFLPGGFRGKVTLASMLFDSKGNQRLQGGLLPGEDPNRQVISTDLKVEPGNSGGPLLNQEFKVIGVVGMTDVRGSKAGSTPVEDVKNVLAAAHVYDKPNLPVSQRPNNLSNPTNIFPFLQPNAYTPRDGNLGNNLEINAPPSSLQYRLKDKLAPYR